MIPWGFSSSSARFRGLHSYIGLHAGSEDTSRVFRISELVFEDHLNVRLHAHAQERIIANIGTFSANLRIPRRVSTLGARFRGLFKCTTARTCVGENFYAYQTIQRVSEDTSVVFRLSKLVSEAYLSV